MNWIGLFSHSGQEMSDLVRAFPRPIRVITNRTTKPPAFKYPLEYHDHGHINRIILSVQEHTLITLHGYNRLLPRRVVENRACEIYNVHPGDIVRYPELVGLHPQRKALELGLPSTGVIIHQVTHDMDRGPIMKYKQVNILRNETEEHLIERLRNISVKLWMEFLVERGI